MAGITSNEPPRGASALFLREPEVRRGVEMLYFGNSRLFQAIDARLAAEGLGRAHHRALYFIARKPGITVGDLLALLSITKQSLGRVLNDLAAREMLESRTGTRDRRQKLLRLTATGSTLEAELFETLRVRMAAAYSSAGQTAVGGFWAVLEGLVPPGDRAAIAELARSAEPPPHRP